MWVDTDRSLTVTHSPTHPLPRCGGEGEQLCQDFAGMWKCNACLVYSWMSSVLGVLASMWKASNVVPYDYANATFTCIAPAVCHATAHHVRSHSVQYTRHVKTIVIPPLRINCDTSVMKIGDEWGGNLKHTMQCLSCFEERGDSGRSPGFDSGSYTAQCKMCQCVTETIPITVISGPHVR